MHGKGLLQELLVIQHRNVPCFGYLEMLPLLGMLLGGQLMVLNQGVIRHVALCFKMLHERVFVARKAPLMRGQLGPVTISELPEFVKESTLEFGQRAERLLVLVAPDLHFVSPQAIFRMPLRHFRM
jgi:hypothetical protein